MSDVPDDVTASTPRAARSWLDRVVDSSGSVYGIILASSIIAALSYKERGNAWVMVGALVASEVVFALAHALSTLLGGGRVRGALPGFAEVRGALRYEWPVLQAAWPTIGLLLLAAIGLLGVDNAVNFALAVNAAILFVWGLAVARQQGVTAPVAIGVGMLSCGLGVAIVALKLALH
jgi:hypothetical protein